jgi:fumarate hydratase class II
MPGKINPTQCEALTMVAVQVFGQRPRGRPCGLNFQLNVYKPVILHNVLESIRLLAEGARSFSERCAAGIEPNLARCTRSGLEPDTAITGVERAHGSQGRAREQIGRAPDQSRVDPSR